MKLELVIVSFLALTQPIAADWIDDWDAVAADQSYNIWTIVNAGVEPDKLGSCHVSRNGRCVTSYYNNDEACKFWPTHGGYYVKFTRFHTEGTHDTITIKSSHDNSIIMSPTAGGIGPGMGRYADHTYDFYWVTDHSSSLEDAPDTYGGTTGDGGWEICAAPFWHVFQDRDPAWDAESDWGLVETCHITDDGKCISATHEHNDRCTFRALSKMTARTTGFNTEATHDKLVVEGIEYHGTDGPTDAHLTRGESVVWFTDGSQGNADWSMCAHDPVDFGARVTAHGESVLHGAFHFPDDGDQRALCRAYTVEADCWEDPKCSWNPGHGVCNEFGYQPLSSSCVACAA